MYNLQYTPIKLKQYALKIKQSLATGMPINCKFDVKIEQDAELRHSTDDSKALEVSIHIFILIIRSNTLLLEYRAYLPEQ